MQGAIGEGHLRKLLSSVKCPSRYIGGEWGSGPVKEGEGLVRMCYAFPDVYEVGMSYLGFQILYGLTKSLPFADAERVYTPWPDMEASMRGTNTPIWALESKRPLKDFDVIGFTLQYELAATNILTILDLAGIPFRSAERREEDPLIVAGGIGALAPEPLAPFFDAFMVGDGEVLIPEVLETLHETKGSDRAKKLEALSKIEGVYVPMIHGREKTIRRRIVENLDEAYYPDKMIVPNGKITHDRATLQVFKGCTRGCRFCQAGTIDRPLRERSAESACEELKKLLASTGWEEVGLLSLATCDWSGLTDAIERLKPLLDEKRIKISLPSLRVDAFTVNFAAGLETMRKGGLTLAPEAGTQRLRDVINKGVTDEEIDAAFEATFAHGWDKLKLYFMMGLPTETTEDLDGILEICGRAVSTAKRHKRKGEVKASVAGFVPKAHTPFQWEAQAPIEELTERAHYIKRSVKNRKISIAYHEPEQTFLEGVFARGDARLADAIEEVWRRGGRFDGWTEHFDFGRWRGVFEDLGIDPASYTRARGLDERLPWDHIDCGVTKEYLMREREKSLSAETTRDCRLGCNGCGWQGKTTANRCNHG